MNAYKLLIGYYISMTINIVCESGSSFPSISEPRLLFRAGVLKPVRYFIVSGFITVNIHFPLKI
jgi:hypothetical protein